MFYNQGQATTACLEEPSLIFELIKEGHLELVDKLVMSKKVSINTSDMEGNSLLMRLLKNKNYDMVLRYMNNKNWDVNHQNNDGETFGHILATINYVNVLEIMKLLKQNKNFAPNIKNNIGETMLDKSINHNYIYTTAKILEDKRFDNMDVISFKKFYEAYIRNNSYGKYSKVMNLEMLVDNLETRSLLPRMKKLIHYIHVNFDSIKKEMLNENNKRVDSIVFELLEENY
ncbi:MAG: hypothetical protein RSE91_02455 [Bacilli bacterium]